METVEKIRQLLLEKFKTLEDKRSILRSTELKGLYEQIKDQPEESRAIFGQAVNALKKS